MDLLWYCSIPSPLGELFLAATEEGVCRIVWESSEAAFVVALEESWARAARRCEAGSGVACGASPAHRRLAEAGRQLDDYFGGQRRAFDLPLDLSRQRPFPRQVLTTLCQVPFGEVVNYGELAERAGYRGAARAVGGVMRANPLPILIPCHRVLKSDGSLGGFGGRPHFKEFLLELEGRPALALEY